jgi:amicyanin
MKKNSLIAVVVAAAVVLVGGLAIYATNQNKPHSMSGMSSSEMKDMDSDNMADKSSDTAEATNSVTIQDFAYSPKHITVKVGTTVTWTNQDSVKHNVVSDADDGPDGPLLAKGETYNYTFKKAGSFDYHCDPHPYMKGTVTVTE